MARYLKNERQTKILELIDKFPIQDAGTLQQALADNGFVYDEATIYRDIADLHLVTSVRHDGHIGFATPARIAHESLAERLSKLTIEAAMHVETLGIYVKVACIHGCAEAVATSVNALSLEQVFCCVVARDDVLIICRSEDDAKFVYKILGKVINK